MGREGKGAHALSRGWERARGECRGLVLVLGGGCRGWVFGWWGAVAGAGVGGWGGVVAGGERGL